MGPVLRARLAPRRGAFARYGRDTWLCPPVEVAGAAGIELGDGIVLLDGCALRAADGARLVVGDGVRLGRFCTLAAARSVTVGRRVSGSDGVVVTDTWGPVAAGVPWPVGSGPVAPEPAPVVIEDGAYLGAGCVVGPGVTVGAGAYVGEGAVVVVDVPAHARVHGNPARLGRR